MEPSGIALAERPATTPCCTISGFDVTVLPRTRHHGIDDPQLREALHLERTTMRLLGDTPDEIDADLAETLDLSSFALVTHPPAVPWEQPRLVGAVRFMTGRADGVKTLWDIERMTTSSTSRRRHPWLSDPAQLVDAMSLAVALDTATPVAELATVLLGVSRCLGGALLSRGRARFVTGNLHRRFLRHAARIRYPFEPLVADDHPASGAFVPVIASLGAYDEAIRVAPEGSHLGAIRAEYVRVGKVACALGTEEW